MSQNEEKYLKQKIYRRAHYYYYFFFLREREMLGNGMECVINKKIKINFPKIVQFFFFKLD